MSVLSTIANLDPIALWGAVLSTILAVVKFHEIWEARTKIEVTYDLASSPEIGNKIIIRNLSGKPIIITYWELYWQKRKYGIIPVIMNGIYPNEEFPDKKLEAHSSTSITLAGSSHFEWNKKALGKSKIYLYLHIAGRKKPIRKYYYG